MASRPGASSGWMRDGRWHGWAVLAFAAAVFLGTVYSPPSLLDDVDSTYAQIARSMLDSGDWITARLNGAGVLRQAGGTGLGNRPLVRSLRRSRLGGAGADGVGRRGPLLAGLAYRPMGLWGPGRAVRRYRSRSLLGLVPLHSCANARHLRRLLVTAGAGLFPEGAGREPARGASPHGLGRCHSGHRPAMQGPGRGGPATRSDRHVSRGQRRLALPRIVATPGIAGSCRRSNTCRRSVARAVHRAPSPVSRIRLDSGPVSTTDSSGAISSTSTSCGSSACAIRSTTTGFPCCGSGPATWPGYSPGAA